MAQSITELVNNLPKPETLEEQYMYALVCSVAGVTPRYGVAENAAFKRMDQFWKAFWLVASQKFTALETPAANSVSNEAIRNEAVTEEKVSPGAVTLDKLSDAVEGRLWDADRDESVITDYIADGAITTGKIDDSAVTTAKVADGAITSAKIAEQTIHMANLDQEIQDKLDSIILSI